MANRLIIGSTLVKPEEYLEQKQLGNIEKLLTSLEQGKKHSIEFSTGSVDTTEINNSFENMSGFFENDDTKIAHPFTPIGLGLPLCVEILTIYTGDYPNGIFGGKKDLMLTSAIKSSVTFDAAA